MREIIKEVTLTFEDDKEMKFEITKMNAFDGTKLAKFMTEKILPAIGEMQEAFVVKDGEETYDLKKLAEERTQNILPLIGKLVESISEEELISLEKTCLSTVKCRMPAGYQKVLNGESFCIPELEYDTANVLLLCYYVIEFNTKGFFGGKRWASALSKLNSFLPGA